MNRYKVRTLKNVVSAVLVVLTLLFSFIALVNLTFNALYIKTHVKGFSMQPTLNINVADPLLKGDTIYINKYSSLTNGDIVVAKPEWPGLDDYIIKRVVGMPGDKIQIKEFDNYFAIYVNDYLFYKKDKYGENQSFPKTGSYAYFDLYNKFLNNDKEFEQWIRGEGENKYIQLGDDDYFLMGDNWGHTTDCLTYGPIKSSDIVGRVDIVIDATDNNPFTSFKYFLKKLFTF